MSVLYLCPSPICLLFRFSSRSRYAWRFAFFYLCSFYGHSRRDGHKKCQIVAVPVEAIIPWGVAMAWGTVRINVFQKRHTSNSKSFTTRRTNYKNSAVSQAKFSSSFRSKLWRTSHESKSHNFPYFANTLTRTHTPTHTCTHTFMCVYTFTRCHSHLDFHWA